MLIKPHFCGRLMNQNAHSFYAYLASLLTSFSGAFSLNDWALIVGILGTVATCVWNGYQKYRMRKAIEKMSNQQEAAAVYDKIK